MQHQPPALTYQRQIILALAGFLVLYILWILYQPDPAPTLRPMLGGLSLFFSSLVAFSLAWWTKNLAGEVRLKQSWGWLVAGLALWGTGDGIQLTRSFFSSGIPILVIIQVLINILGSLLVLIGVIHYPRNQRTNVSRLRLLLDLTVSTAALLSLVWLIFLQPTFQLLTGDSSGFLTSLPATSDLILLMILLNLFFLTEPVSFPIPFLWLGLGFSAFLVSDLAHAYQQAQSSYTIGGIIDIGWVAGDFLIALAALSQTSGKPAAPAAYFSRALTRIQSLLPLVSVLSLGWYAILAWQVTGRADPLALWMTVLLSLGLIARQGIVTGEVEFQKYADLVNSIAEPTFVCDRGGKLVLANPALLHAVGEPVLNRLLEQPLTALVETPEDLRFLIQVGTRQGWSGEAFLRRVDGSKIPISLALRPVRKGAGERLVIAGTAHDLSEQKHQQAALQAAYEQITAAHTQLSELNQQLETMVAEKTADLSHALRQLEEQNRALLQLDQLKSDFVSMVSHELRAPLTNISGGIELLLSSPENIPKSANSTLELVQAEILRLARFVESILDISALDAGRMPVYPEPLAAEKVMRTVQTQSHHLAGIERVRWVIPEDLPPVIADERALTSILFHLLDNALKYAPEGEILIIAGKSNGKVYLEVNDQGPGIPEDALALLFTRFYRVQSSDAQSIYGHGLGLYIVRRLLEAMGGDITVSNRPSGGACFTCWLLPAD